jgi:uncharacterized protein (TIGR00251 family)
MRGVLPVGEGDDGCTFRVHVVPRSRRDEVVGLYGDALKVRLAASPVDNKANRSLARFLGAKLSVPPSCVEILGGHTSRHKRVRVYGVTTNDVLALLQD